ncbi:MAG TPA: LuxR C-terminal-related transcriptional regulator [Bacteroidia bacterium]|nr:LuxR C-terminal-related transcriptional regulator [Bacteroidia bacterium]
MPLTQGINRYLIKLLDTAQDGVLILDMEGNIKYVNRSLSNTFEIDAIELVNQPCNVFSTDPKIIFLEIVRDLSIKQYVVKNLKCKIANDKILDFTASFTFLRDDVTIHSGVMVVLKNRILQSESEKKFLAQQHNLLRSMNMRTDEICIVYNMKNYRSIFCSDTIEQILGWTAEEYINGGWAFSLAITHPEDAHLAQEVFSREVKKRKASFSALDHIPITIGYRKRTKSGEYRQMYAETWVLDRDENGELFHVIIFLKDVTVEKLKNKIVINNGILELVHNGVNHIKIEGAHLISKIEPSRILQLSEREREILALIKTGLSTKEIASKLSLKVNTINTYRKNLMNKLNAKNSAELVNIAMEQNIM